MFRKRIKDAYKSLTPSFKRLGDFIISHELDVAFMTATELAKALDVDAATVVRFSQALGYSGYRELSH
ncbi:MAG: N-acetylmannosamine kinase, partial [Anaerolineae bacterium]